MRLIQWTLIQQSSVFTIPKKLGHKKETPRIWMHKGTEHLKGWAEEAICKSRREPPRKPTPLTP
jgi:hypothetical protein